MTDATPREIQTEGAAADELPPPTAPENMSIRLRCFDTETDVRSLNSYIDLTTLDGITIALDYAQALLDLDRGYATSFSRCRCSDIMRARHFAEHARRGFSVACLIMMIRYFRTRKRSPTAR
ncbi:hypothetical protein [Bradyrhizobium cosmicum]|uniref:hypothetical protein n=1 Tax=Bradyrhizobium cosmicum TaxID=1404864 RepID=UPI0028E765F1|nr:hypothetical protein [Bradyrhizobium cosmicum]